MSYINSSKSGLEMYKYSENEKKVAKGLLLMKARGCKLDGLLESDLKRGIIRVMPK